MSKTDIEWADYTFNPWSGCTKVTEGCKNCYAAALPPRMRRSAEWGPDQPRVIASDSYWAQPLAWARTAARKGLGRPRVFCASTADVFEERRDLDPWRERLWALIHATPEMDWLLLTKRANTMLRWFQTHTVPANVWAGISVASQREMNERMPYLAEVRASVRFLSMEPLVGPVDLDPTWCHYCNSDEHVYFQPDSQPWCIECDTEAGSPGWEDKIDWIIVGGESGRRARPMAPVWVRDLQKQAGANHIPFFFKQWGEWAPRSAIVANGRWDGSEEVFEAAPKRLLYTLGPIEETLYRLGKAHTGRHLPLGGAAVIFEELPTPAPKGFGRPL